MSYQGQERKCSFDKLQILPSFSDRMLHEDGLKSLHWDEYKVLTILRPPVCTNHLSQDVDYTILCLVGSSAVMMAKINSRKVFSPPSSWDWWAEKRKTMLQQNPAFHHCMALSTILYLSMDREGDTAH